jgi:hypothetical protein
MKMKLLLIGMLILLAVLIGFNWQTAIARITMGREASRLRQAAWREPAIADPASVHESFANKLTPGFWNAVIINSDRLVSAGPTFGAVDYRVENGGLAIRHQIDPDFDDKTAEAWAEPAPARYNNATLVSSQAFLPTDTHDVVVRFRMGASQGYYGSAGLVLQPQGLLGQDGLFTGPFNLFGVMLIGSESLVQGVSGPVCTLAVSWMPVLNQQIDVDMYADNEYEIRLSRLENRDWLASVSANGQQVCETTMPSLGPVVAHVWSDNYLFVEQPRHFFHLWPPMPKVEFQNGGFKEVWFGPIEISNEAKR